MATHKYSRLDDLLHSIRFTSSGHTKECGSLTEKVLRTDEDRHRLLLQLETTAGAIAHLSGLDISWPPSYVSFSKVDNQFQYLCIGLNDTVVMRTVEVFNIGPEMNNSLLVFIKC